MKTLFFLLLSFSSFAQVISMTDQSGAKWKFTDSGNVPTILSKYSDSVKFILGKGTIYFPNVLVIEGADTTQDVEITVIARPRFKPDLVTNIDNVDNKNQYSANWNPFANQTWTQNHFNKTITFTTVTGSSVKITIDGYKFEWWSERRLNHGIASIQIDNQTPVDVDQYEKRTDNNSLLVYTSPELTNGPHTVTITMTGRKNPAWSTDYPAGTAAQNQLRIESQQNNIMHDYIKVYKKQ